MRSQPVILTVLLLAAFAINLRSWSRPGRMRPAHKLRQRYGPWALITGASSGIGQACAEELAAAGLDVVLVARRHDQLARLATRLHDQHRVDTRVLAVDLAQPEGPQAVADHTSGLDIGLLVAAAGFGTAGRLLYSNLAEQLAMLDVKCGAVLALTHLIGTRMTATRVSGGIILFGSLVGRQGAPGSAHYSATKAWVQALGEALHIELARHGIDVLTATPGPVRSGFADRAGMHLAIAANPSTVAAGALHGLWKNA